MAARKAVRRSHPTRYAAGALAGAITLGGLFYVSWQSADNPSVQTNVSYNSPEYRNFVDSRRQIREDLQLFMNSSYCEGDCLFDLNEDGRNENLRFLPDRYGWSVSAPDGRSLLNGKISRISPEKTNGYHDVFDQAKILLPDGTSADGVVKYIWNGERYVESSRFLIDPVRTAAQLRQSLVANDRNERRRILSEVENLLGPVAGLDILFMINPVPGISMPTDVEYEKYLEVAAARKGLDHLTLRAKYGNDRDAFARDFYGHSMEALIADPTNKLALIRIFAKRGAEALGFTEWREHLNTLVEAGGSSSGRIERFRKSKHRDPTPRELENLNLYNAITEEPNDPWANETVRERRSYDPVSGTETVAREVMPGATQSDRLRAQQEDNNASLQAQRAENARRFREDVNRANEETQRRLNEAKKKLNEIIKK